METPQIQLQGLLKTFPRILEKEKQGDVINQLQSNLNASVSPATKQRATDVLFEGIRLYEDDQNDAAYQKFEESNNIFANGDAWHHKGVINFHRGNFKRAIEEFSAAILLYREYASAYRFRALSIILLLEDNGLLYRGSELEQFAKQDLKVAVRLGDQEAQRAIEEFYKGNLN